MHVLLLALTLAMAAPAVEPATPDLVLEQQPFAVYSACWPIRL